MAAKLLQNGPYAGRDSLDVAREADAWLSQHWELRRPYEGQWIAFVPGKIVAGDKSLKELMKKPEVKAVRPYVAVDLVSPPFEGILAPSCTIG